MSAIGDHTYAVLDEPIREVVLHLFDECLGTFHETKTPPDPDHCSWCRMRQTVLLLVGEHQRLREELMRCGLLAVSHRQDGCIGKKAAERIREIAHRNCWPTGEDTG